MRNELQKFHETVDILVRAYLNDLLIPSNSCACAVGNIISKTDRKYNFYENGLSWYSACGLNQLRPGYIDNYHPDVIKSGYSVDELIKIEASFMRPKKLTNDRIFSGLMAVLEVLAEIHKVDLSVKESAKLQFVKI